MNTTNYEISKKLWKIGFKAETMCYWDNDSKECQYWSIVPNEQDFTPSYDLETILDALPPRIKVKGKVWHFELEHCEVCYSDALPRDPDFIYITAMSKIKEL